MTLIWWNLPPKLGKFGNFLLKSWWKIIILIWQHCGALRTRSDPPSCQHGCSRLQLSWSLKEYGRSRLFTSESKSTGVLGFWIRSLKARAFPALPPLNIRPGRSRPSSFRRIRAFPAFCPCLKARVFSVLPPHLVWKNQRRFETRASRHAPD